MINESKILELIKRQKDTGLSITAFCANEGIPKSSYYYWRKKLTREPGKHIIPLLANSTAVNMNNNDYSLDLADLLPLNWKAARELQKAPVQIQYQMHSFL